MMPTSKMFFFSHKLPLLDDLQYIEIIRYDFFFRSIIFGLTFFFCFSRELFFGFANFQSDFNDFFKFH